MDVGRAFGYAFEDRDWFGKLFVTLLVTAFALLLTPLLIGLLGWALLLGYQEELVYNIRLERKTPLPRWNNLEDKISRGLAYLGASIVYNIPNMILGCCLATLSPAVGGQGAVTSATTTIGIACCVFPLLILYNLVTVPMIAIGLGHYNEERRIGVFFEFGRLFALLREHIDATIPYLLWMVIATIVLGLISVTLIGIPVTLALLIPVQGMLTAQFIGLVLPKPKEPEPKKAGGNAPPPRTPQRKR